MSKQFDKREIKLIKLETELTALTHFFNQLKKVEATPTGERSDIYVRYFFKFVSQLDKDIKRKTKRLEKEMTKC